MIDPIVIIGGGPAGLTAAQILGEFFSTHPSADNPEIHLYEAKASIGRKFLQAGKGGLNLTHQLGLKEETWETFIEMYGVAGDFLKSFLKEWGSKELITWIEALGHQAYTGSSGRIFPTERKAGPLLHSWKSRLLELGIHINTGFYWNGWKGDKLIFHYRTDNTSSIVETPYTAMLLALGGASWPQLGSDGKWTRILSDQGIDISPWRPSNCGFSVLPEQSGWSSIFIDKCPEGVIKSIALKVCDLEGGVHSSRGDLVITPGGIEGGPVYALSRFIRDILNSQREGIVELDLTPDLTEEKLASKLNTRSRKKSLSSFLKNNLGWKKETMALLFELLPGDQEKRNNIINNPQDLSCQIKHLKLPLHQADSLEKAISSAGGIKLKEVDENLMLKRMPGVYVAGEMLDWEAPTGGYLLTAVMSTGAAAAKGILKAFQP